MFCFYEIVPNKIVGSPPHIFTYESEKKIPIGAIVAIPVGSRHYEGLVVKEVKKPAFLTKPVEHVILPSCIPSPLIQTARWISQYYASPLPRVIQHLWPEAPDRKTVMNKNLDLTALKNSRESYPLTNEQSTAVNAILERNEGTTVLHGVTGSGKTRVYIEIAKNTLKAGKSVLILVPEIALTPQAINEFKSSFKKVSVTHSRLTTAQRRIVWRHIAHTSKPQVVIGARSALFAPLSNIGLIVVDEFHESAYKQEQTPRYHAVRVASQLSRAHQARLILGSATPSIVDLKLARASKTPVVELTKTASKSGGDAKTLIVDMRHKDERTSKQWLSKTLKNAITTTLEQNKQVLLYYNRRGTATLTLCQECGWIHDCPKCHLPLTLHADLAKALCHICGNAEPIKIICPNCKSPAVKFKGVGTKQIEHDVLSLFRGVKTARFDSDTKKSESIATRFRELQKGSISIIIGTQVVAKGHDLPRLGLVGIVLPDINLKLPDYTASERTFQLLYQAAGRVGRHSIGDKVIVQTFQPDHPAIKLGVKRNFDSFYRRELLQRKLGQYPPYSHLMKLICAYSSRFSAQKEAKRLKQLLLKQQLNAKILGPTPAFHEQISGTFRWQLIVKAKSRDTLTSIAAYVPNRWIIDLDPINLL